MFKIIKTAAEVQAEKDQTTKEQRIFELKQFLADTDYKVLPDYDKSTEEIKTQRQAWRDEILERGG